MTVSIVKNLTPTLDSRAAKIAAVAIGVAAAAWLVARHGRSRMRAELATDPEFADAVVGSLSFPRAFEIGARALFQLPLGNPYEVG